MTQLFTYICIFVFFVALVIIIICIARHIIGLGNQTNTRTIKYSAATMFWLVFAIGYLQDKADTEAGFNGSADRTAAKEAGITDPAEWKIKRAAIEIETRKIAEAKAALDAEQRRAKEQARAEAEKEQEDRCRADLGCWSEKYAAKATRTCRKAIESLAKIDVRWDDGFTEPMFSHVRWASKTIHSTITYVGDRAQMQNGFGAWIRHTYECDFDPRLDAVSAVRAKVGKI